METLTPKELEVLKFVAKGLKNKVISNELYITVDTVKAHLTSIMKKLNVTSRTEAVYVALINNIITLE